MLIISFNFEKYMGNFIRKNLIMYSAKVYNIMFGSPSDITDEFDAFCEIVYGWNSLHSNKCGIVLLPIHWSTHSFPLTGENSQKIIDKSVVSKSDLLICVFGSRLGTNTDTHLSGTVEEIDEHIKAGKDVMIYFKKTATIDLDDFDPLQLEKLKNFKNLIKEKCLYSEISDTQEFHDQLFKDIQLYVNEKWLSSPNDIIGVQDISKYDGVLSLSEFDLERLRAWTSVDNPQFYSAYLMGGRAVFGLGAVNQFEVQNGKELVEWNDFFERMMDYGFIDIEKYDKYGHPVYRIKKAAYDYMHARNLTL